ARGEFLAAMSHEIRTPMTGVLGVVDLLEAEKLTAKQERYVESIRASGRHLLNIINDILDFSRIETGKIELENVDFSLPIVLERVRSLLNPLAMERGIELHFELGEHSPPVVKGDPTRLKQVLLNLAGNAIKFTAEGRVVVAVSYQRLDQGLRFRFEVRDTGIGVPLEAQATLFNAFTQADHSTKRQYGGTGLGLAISKRLVDAMGGEIGVESEPGTGSVFWFEVPFEEGDAIQLPRPGAAPEAPIAPRRVLVAEDVELNRDIIRTVLERDGHDVVFAWNGRQAVELARQFPFDLVLMDVQMPLMDGVEATRQIRQLPGPAADTPIIALTANVMATEQEKCIEAGMNEVLMKPIEWERVRAVIRRYEVRSAGTLWKTPPTIAGIVAGAGEKPSDPPQPEENSSEPAFVEATFLKLRELIPAERLAKYLEALETDVAALSAAAPGGDAVEASALQGTAHKIVSQAGMLGLIRLSKRAARVEDAYAEKNGVETALREFREAAADVQERLWPLVPRSD
ncbi:MAG: ATP-binding protein, partial [Pseudomonadota bacterium]|nr:ATP-binding protein [Pseudomonadota bacterium]